MHNPTKLFLLASVIVTGVAASTALYAAEGSDEPSSPMMGNGMMGHGDTSRGGGMMGKGKMSQMMDHCSNKMGNDRPNEQWRRNSPSN
jgi:hypothetical protein